MDIVIQHDPGTQFISERASTTRFEPGDFPIGVKTPMREFAAYDCPRAEAVPDTAHIGTYLTYRTADFHLGLIHSVRQGH